MSWQPKAKKQCLTCEHMQPFSFFLLLAIYYSFLWVHIIPCPACVQPQPQPPPLPVSHHYSIHLPTFLSTHGSLPLVCFVPMNTHIIDWSYLLLHLLVDESYTVQTFLIAFMHIHTFRRDVPKDQESPLFQTIMIR